MASKRTILRQQRDARRAERFSAYGRAQEHHIKDILEKSRLFDEVILHPANSNDDASGKDLTVRRGKLCRSFGVTISMKSWGRSKALHPQTPQFYFPLNVKPETVIRRIDSLFKEHTMANEQFEIEYSPGSVVIDPEHGRGEIVEALLTVRITKERPETAQVSIVYKCEFRDGATTDIDHITIANLVERQPEKGYVS